MIFSIAYQDYMAINIHELQLTANFLFGVNPLLFIAVSRDRMSFTLGSTVMRQYPGHLVYATVACS